VSSRLIVEKQGFVDFTGLQCSNTSATMSSSLDLNGSIIDYSSPTVVLNLSLPGDGSVHFTVNKQEWSCAMLKPLLIISDSDTKFMDEMISAKYVSYQGTLDGPGKSVEEIRALGNQFFPFSPYNFQLAMEVYD
jgi:hypothetical protein